MDDLFSLMGAMSPEDRKQMAGMGSLDDRSRLLGQQIAMAQALRRDRNYKSSAQATMGGIGGALGAIGEHFGLLKQGDLLRQQDEGRAKYMSALANAVRGQANPQNPLAMAEAGAAVAAQNPDMGQLALPAQPSPNPGNAGMGDTQPGGPQAHQKGWGSTQVDPRLRQPFFRIGYG